MAWFKPETNAIVFLCTASEYPSKTFNDGIGRALKPSLSPGSGESGFWENRLNQPSVIHKSSPLAPVRVIWVSWWRFMCHSMKPI